jgi:hypothetical protein
MLQKCGESGEAVKQSYREKPLFIGEEGVVPRSCLEMTVARFRGDACTLRRFQGDVFYRNSKNCSWKQIVGVNPLPRGASVGELGKNLSPSKLRRCQESYEFR